MRRIVGALASIALVVLTQLTPSPQEASVEDCFRARVNAERDVRGIPKLEPDATLTRLARVHSEQMAERGTIFHNDELAEEAPAFAYLGENVGMGPTCDSIHQAFMASPGHRENILDTDYTRLGVGVTIKDNEESSSGVTIYVTEDFGSTPMEDKPAPKPPAKKPSAPAPKCTCPR